MKPRIAQIAVIGVLAASFALAGCGRKGPLDPPPGSAASQQPPAQAASPTVFSPVAEPSRRPTPPAAPKRSLPIDWLID